MAAPFNLSTATGKPVAPAASYARNPWQRFRGLMMRRSLPAGGGLVIEPCSSIHMMFMLFGIDAVFYDKDGRVTRVAPNVKPWVGMAWSKGAHGVVELPKGGAAGLERGDQLVFPAA